jgi:copper homeostasis protein
VEKKTKSSSIRIEACVNSTASAIQAQKGGAYRVELCDNLYDGGTTPGPGSIEAAREHLDIQLNVIIRPRGGDFLYSDLEFEIMKREVALCRERKVDGVVFGILLPGGAIDVRRTAELVSLAGPMSTTFHRAFDMTSDPIAALDDLIGLGVDRVLTSGQRPSALEGVDLIASLVRAAGDQIIVMPGVGIDADNVGELIRRTGATEFHVLAQKSQASRMEFKNEAVFMGTDPDLSEYEVQVTDHEQIRMICERAREAGAGKGQ